MSLITSHYCCSSKTYHSGLKRKGGSCASRCCKNHTYCWSSSCSCNRNRNTHQDYTSSNCNIFNYLIVSVIVYFFQRNNRCLSIFSKRKDISCAFESGI